MGAVRFGAATWGKAGKAGPGLEWLGEVWQVRHGTARRDMERHGNAGVVWNGRAW